MKSALLIFAIVISSNCGRASWHGKVVDFCARVLTGKTQPALAVSEEQGTELVAVGLLVNQTALSLIRYFELDAPLLQRHCEDKIAHIIQFGSDHGVPANVLREMQQIADNDIVAIAYRGALVSAEITPAQLKEVKKYLRHVRESSQRTRRLQVSRDLVDYSALDEIEKYFRN